MDKRRLAILLFVLNVLSLLFFIVLAIYHIFSQEKLWGFSVWLVLDIVTYFVVKGVAVKYNIDYKHMFSQKSNQDKFENISVIVGTVFFAIVFLPFTLLLLISALFFAYKTRAKKMYESLLQKGFELKKDKKNHCYLLQKQDVVVAFSFDENDYTISFDGGKTFVDVVESMLGTSAEREKLKAEQQEYKNALPVLKQRHEIDSPTKSFVSFLARYLD